MFKQEVVGASQETTTTTRGEPGGSRARALSQPVTECFSSGSPQLVPLLFTSTAGRACGESSLSVRERPGRRQARRGGASGDRRRRTVQLRLKLCETLRHRLAPFGRPQVAREGDARAGPHGRERRRRLLARGAAGGAAPAGEPRAVRRGPGERVPDARGDGEKTCRSREQT